MYQMVQMEDTVRIPPSELGEDQDAVVKTLVHREFEGRLNKKHGFTVLAADIERLGEGRLVHGDGAVYQRVRFNALTFKPEVGEIVEGTICEVVEFGAFVRFGPLDGLLHMSQIMNDYLNVDLGQERLVGKETGRTLAIGDRVRARLVTVSLNELSPRESKIGLTMRQPGLGKIEWLEEDRDPNAPKPVRQGGGGRGGPRGGGRGPRGPPRGDGGN
ncbi:MAG TPA: DNA-directed RNA polymerase [Candidatus Thermoplasmatota archaeon]|nr:DNA-directed RNA polymerase [Candidatus Thermoplasmatota archaeon]HVL86760.1 DNA-directed RNA polymerase [Candidatus Thermoplasmatota archaeon]